MASKDSSANFSVVLVQPTGKSCELDGLHSSDTLTSLYGSAAKVTGIPEHMLKLAFDSGILPALSGDSLSVAGLKSGSVITVLRSVDPQIFCRGYDCRRDAQWDFFECESHERLLLDFDGSCFFIGLDRLQTEWSMDGHDVLQWDILHGTYEKVDNVAVCNWQRHLHRKISIEQHNDSPVDRGWEEMDAQASLKWQRIRLPGHKDDAEFRARIANAASVDGGTADLFKFEWFHQAAAARCREWPAASFGDGIQPTGHTPYWGAISAMTSEEAQLSAGALQRLCAEEEQFLAEEPKAQTGTVDCDNSCWKRTMEPIRLDTIYNDHDDDFAMPPMDAIRAVGSWRELHYRSTLDILEKGDDSFRAIDMRNGCVLGIPLLCPGGVQREGQPNHKGGSWVQEKGKEGSATAAEIISALLMALQSAPTAISAKPTAQELAAAGQANYRFTRSREGRSLIRLDEVTDEEMNNGDIVIVVVPFSTDNDDGDNLELKVGDWGTLIESNPAGGVSVQFPRPTFASHWISAEKVGNLKKKEFCHICVTGAGTSACNGKYVADGTICSKIRYRHESGEYTIDECGTHWLLSKNFESPDYYKAIDPDDNLQNFPPLDGWCADETCIGDLPAPSITVVK